MRIGIDASNVRGLGGGLIYLIELLRYARPELNGFDQIIIWGSSATLNQLEDHPWLLKAHHLLLDGQLPHIFFWQRNKFDSLLIQAGCDVLLVLGGSYFGSFRPFVTMSHNLLPFEWSEARRYGFSWWTLKFILLRISQLSTLKRANSIIFLSEYARTLINKQLVDGQRATVVIPHGVENRFRQEPRPQKKTSNYSWENPFRLLYVSPIAPYKHHLEVIEAVKRVRDADLPVSLILVGPIRNWRKKIYKTMANFDPTNEWLEYLGEISFDKLHTIYHESDAFLFASSCENLPIILLEAMTAGLPIACSNRGPMPEVLGEAGIYFDPENPENISESIQILFNDPGMREQKAFAAYQRSKVYTWEKCAQATFDIINKTYADFIN